MLSNLCSTLVNMDRFGLCVRASVLDARVTELAPAVAL